jgi:hypothetical protein
MSSTAHAGTTRSGRPPPSAFAPLRLLADLRRLAAADLNLERLGQPAVAEVHRRGDVAVGADELRRHLPELPPRASRGDRWNPTRLLTRPLPLERPVRSTVCPRWPTRRARASSACGSPRSAPCSRGCRTRTTPAGPLDFVGELDLVGDRQLRPLHLRPRQHAGYVPQCGQGTWNRRRSPHASTPPDRAVPRRRRAHGEQPAAVPYVAVRSRARLIGSASRPANGGNLSPRRAGRSGTGATRATAASRPSRSRSASCRA